MNPYFLTYKSIGISWFSVLSMIGIIGSYFIIKSSAKENKYSYEKIENIFLC